jgi:hypothetical protein
MNASWFKTILFVSDVTYSKALAYDKAALRFRGTPHAAF